MIPGHLYGRIVACDVEKRPDRRSFDDHLNGLFARFLDFIAMIPKDRGGFVEFAVRWAPEDPDGDTRTTPRLSWLNTPGFTDDDLAAAVTAWSRGTELARAVAEAPGAEVSAPLHPEAMPSPLAGKGSGPDTPVPPARRPAPRRKPAPPA